MSLETRIEELEKAKALLKATRYSNLTREEKITRLKALMARRNPLCPNCPNCRTVDKCQRLFRLTNKCHEITLS
jgi:hypothetical protein